MGLRKPISANKSESVTSMKKIKTKRVTRATRAAAITLDSVQTPDRSVRHSEIDQNERPALVTYEAVPIFVMNK
jgi:hypothetical protein